MLLDAHNYFGESAALSSSPLYSANAINLSSVKELGPGEPLYIHVEVSTTLAGSGATIIVDLVTDDSASLGSPTKLQELGVFPAVSVAGTKFVAALSPDHVAAGEQYLALRFTESGGTITGGKIKAWIVSGLDAVKAYSAGSTFV